MKYILLLTMLLTSNSYAYIYAETGDHDMDTLINRMQQKDVEDRLDAIELQQQNAENDRWQKELFDSINSR